MLLKNGLSLKDFNCILPNLEQGKKDVESMERLIDGISFDLEQISSDDASVVFAVAGYETRSVDCECFTVPSCPANAQCFNERDRGGGTELQETVLFLCLIATLVFQDIVASEKQKQFLALKQHRAIFAQTLTRKLSKDMPFLKKCNHMKRIFFVYYNCLAKNFVNNLNSAIISKTSGVMKKITKLLSSSSTS